MSVREAGREDTAALQAALDLLVAALDAGRIAAVALIAADAEGALVPWWGAASALGPHAGSVLRGAVAYLGARMDAAALAPTHEQPIVFGGGDTWTP